MVHDCVSCKNCRTHTLYVIAPHEDIRPCDAKRIKKLHYGHTLCNYNIWEENCLCLCIGLMGIQRDLYRYIGQHLLSLVPPHTTGWLCAYYLPLIRLLASKLFVDMCCSDTRCGRCALQGCGSLCIQSTCLVRPVLAFEWHRLTPFTRR